MFLLFGVAQLRYFRPVERRLTDGVLDCATLAAFFLVETVEDYLAVFKIRKFHIKDLFFELFGVFVEVHCVVDVLFEDDAFF